MTIHDLPAVNATLNGLAAVLLIAGWAFIKRGNIAAHRASMVLAVLTSAIFLASYMTYHTVHGSTPFPGAGVWRTIYFAVLVPHVILAIVMVPMILIVLNRALRGQFERHKRLARITLPIWIYVSVTGVLIYVMLYRISWH